MSISTAFQKLYRPFILTVAAVAFLGVILAPKAQALIAPSVFEQKVAQDGAWVKQAVIKPGNKATLLLAYHNQTTHSERIVLKDAIPARTSLLPGSTYLYNPASPNGAKQTNTINTVGLDSGLLKPGDTAYVILNVTAASASHFSCGDNLMISRGSATIMGTSTVYTSNARITVHKDCATTSPTSTAAAATNTTTTTQATPHYSCDEVAFTVGANRQVTATSFKYTANGGASFTSTEVNWGDGSPIRPVLTTADDSHTYAKDGTYTITVIAHFTVNGRNVTRNCVTTVHVVTPAVTPVIPATATPTATTPVHTTTAQPTQAVQSAHTTTAVATTTQPTTLVNTGAGSSWGIAALIAVLAAGARYVVLRRAARL